MKTLLMDRNLRILMLTVASLLFASSVFADLKTNRRVDVVVLKDGTEIQGVIIMSTAKKIVLIVQDTKDTDDAKKCRERILSRDEIERIEIGVEEGSHEGFTTEVENAQTVISGTGFRKEEKTETSKSGDKKSPPGLGTHAPLSMGKAKTISTEPTVVIPGKMSSKELAEAYLSRFPVLKSAAQMLIGTEGVVSLLDSAQKGDPLARKQADEFLKLFLEGDSALSEKTPPSASTPLKTKTSAKANPKQPKAARPIDAPKDHVGPLNKDAKK
jgi:hypothetical protein